ncbi:hypothetical protein JQ595_32555 [Bradyrhizobium japonicum]|uniref:hypothetical protein n=1 Tax=Bradyrhizobium japonicum TaxID=375 RepID=UPI001BAA246B|nr:hypothetical protein [Bradyrhizobium japonicum]MBR0733488.1 hypothetical protein [Bradyrhizobium japonicum]
MTPADIFNNVAAPNVAAQGGDVGDIRLAVNAILSLDALMGVIHADRYRRGLETGDDIVFRNKLAAQHFEIRLVRDAAFALKHGELRPAARLVQRAEQIKPVGAFDSAVFDPAVFDTKKRVWIEANDAQHTRLADVVRRDVLGVLQGMI